MSTTTTTEPRTVIANDIDESRLRARTIGDLEAEIREARGNARESIQWKIRCGHGGSVANAYNYPALTSAYVVVSDPDGNVVVWKCRLPANKVTHSGILATCLGDEFRPLFDSRFGADKRRHASDLLKLEHASELAE